MTLTQFKNLKIGDGVKSDCNSNCSCHSSGKTGKIVYVSDDLATIKWNDASIDNTPWSQDICERLILLSNYEIFNVMSGGTII